MSARTMDWRKQELKNYIPTIYNDFVHHTRNTYILKANRANVDTEIDTEIIITNFQPYFTVLIRCRHPDGCKSRSVPPTRIEEKGTFIAV